jgi:predicted transcriptional regulator
MLPASMDQITKLMSNRKAMELLKMIAENQLDIKSLEYPKSTIYSTLRMLCKTGLVEREGRTYILSTGGRIWLNAIKKLSMCLQTLSELLTNFPAHRVSFPEEFLLRAHEIKNFRIVTISYSNFLKPSKKCLRYFRYTDNVLGVIPPSFEEHIPLLLEIADDARFEFILRNATELDEGRRFIKVYRMDSDIELALLLTDSFVGMTFPLMTGEFDSSRVMISESEKAIKFGRDLFEFYKAQSERIR